jgi:hypothetical protein
VIHRSRPLRFLGAVVGGWVGVRAAMLWPVGQAIVQAVAPTAAAEAVSAARPPATLTAVRPAPPARSARVTPIAGRIVASSVASVPASREAAYPFPAPNRSSDRAAVPDATITPRLSGVDAPPAFETSRWSASAWAILRPDGRATPFASQLGGSQAGARIAYAIDGARRLAIYARASGAIDTRQQEAAVGIDWRPTRLPVHLVAERRIGIVGIRDGTAIGAFGGVGRTRIAGPVTVEGYAQGGVILRDRSEGYADGSLRATVPVTRRLDLGLGTWGGAQRGAARLDVGPTLGVTLPVARRALRLSADWRQRVAGNARPGSGPALSLGVDF